MGMLDFSTTESGRKILEEAFSNKKQSPIKENKGGNSPLDDVHTKWMEMAEKKFQKIVESHKGKISDEDLAKKILEKLNG